MPMQSNGLIMVDPMQNVASADPKQSQQANSKKNRKNRKKNKNKTEEENVNEQNGGPPKIVTLRNPLFQGASDSSRTQPPMPLQQRNQVPLNINQPASIIKNDNGMFTIRNMALHQALSNGVAQNYRPYSSEAYPTQEVKHDNYSYFSGNTNHPTPTPTPNNGNSAIGQDVLRTAACAPKPSHMAIGSERSLRKQQQTYGSASSSGTGTASSGMNGDMFNSMHNMDTKRPYSAYDMSANYGFNSDFIGSVQNNTQIPTTLQNQYFNVNGGYPFNNQTQTDNTSSLFGSRTTSSLTNSHCCDTSPPAHDPYGSKTTEENFFKKFDDDSFLHGLHPGQRLNSEVSDLTIAILESANWKWQVLNSQILFLQFKVTIHNINDSKFNRKPTPVNLRDGVEITRINGPDGFSTNPNLAVGSQRPTAINDDLNNSASSEFGGKFQ